MIIGKGENSGRYLVLVWVWGNKNKFKIFCLKVEGYIWELERYWLKFYFWLFNIK